MAIYAITEQSAHLQLKTNIAGEIQPIESYLYSFRKLFGSNAGETKSEETQLFHSVAGLYLATLQSMDKETVYDVLTERDCYTIVSLSKSQETVSHVKHRLLQRVYDEADKMHEGDEEEDKIEVELMKQLMDYSLSNSDSADEDSCEAEDFRLVYSSEFSETSDESELTCPKDEEDDQPGSNKPQSERSKSQADSSTSTDSLASTLLAGYKEYIGGCIRRKLDLLKAIKIGERPEDQNLAISTHYSFEHSLAAACSFRVRYPSNKRLRVIHINFLSVRKYLRKKGLGSQLINYVKNPEVVGPYDAIVVHADMEARGFFQKHGFTEDILVNYNWEEYSGEFVNCKMMTYFPGFERKVIKADFVEKDSLISTFDENIEKWRSKSVEAHTEQFVLYHKLRAEIIKLYGILEQKTNEIHQLTCELRQIYADVLTKQLVELPIEKSSYIKDRMRILDDKIALHNGGVSGDSNSPHSTCPVVKCGDVEETEVNTRETQTVRNLAGIDVLRNCFEFESLEPKKLTNYTDFPRISTPV